ncbi:MAG: hypothetical protein U0807_14050 [Candidatus Binatia bacterium]
MTSAPTAAASAEDRLSALVTSPTAPEDALEPALRVLVDETGALAGAICLFDGNEVMLRLAAEVGLSDDGCRLLRTVRRFGPGAWETPLDSVLDERVHVLTVGETDRQIPALVGSDVPVAAVACLPIIRGESPLGSLILVLTDADALAADALGRIAPAIHRLGEIIAATHTRAIPSQIAEASGPRGLFEQLAEAALRRIEPAMREVLRLLEALPGARRDEAALTDPERALARESAARRTLEEALVAERADARARLEAAETAWATERLRGRDLERAIERAGEEHRALLEREQRLRDEAAALTERATADREETLRRAREIVEAAEAARAAAVAEAEGARGSLANAQSTVLGLRDEVRRAWAEADRLETTAAAAKATVSTLERALEEARRQGEAAAERLAHLEAQIESIGQENQRVVATSRTREAELIAQWTARLHEAEVSVAHGREEVAALASEREHLTSSLTETREQVKRARAEITGVIERTEADREATLRHAREMVEAAEAERVAAVAEVEAVREALAASQALILNFEAAQVATEQGVADREESLRTALETARLTEELRVATVAELETVRSNLAEARAARLSLEDEVRRSHSEIARLEATLSHAEPEAQRLTEALDEARATAAAASARAASLEREFDKLRTHTDTLQASAEERERALQTGWHNKLVSAETAWAHERLHARELERMQDRLQAELDDLRKHDLAIRQELETLQARTLADREETLRRALELTESAESARAAAAAECEAVRASLANSQNLILSAEDEARRARSDVERLEAAVQAARADAEQVHHALAESRIHEAQLSARQAELERDLATARQRVASAAAPASKAGGPPPGVAGESPAAEPPAWTPSGDPQRRVVAVLDAEETWRDVTLNATQITIVPPDAEAGTQLAAIDPSRVLVNLVHPDAFPTMISLRAGGFGGRFWGCLAAPGARRTLRLGMIEVAQRPVDAETVLAIVRTYGGRGLRVLAAGGDSNVFISLRQALTRDGMSVSIAWDAKQAADLLGMVRPEVVIVDLGLPPRDGYAYVAQLAGLDPAPVIVMIERGDDAAAGFASALAERVGSEHAVPQDRLIAALFRGNEAPVPARR